MHIKVCFEPLCLEHVMIAVLRGSVVVLLLIADLISAPSGLQWAVALHLPLGHLSGAAPCFECLQPLI